jgi:ribonucleotide monophosphatase NagD (HAD superfamily)
MSYFELKQLIEQQCAPDSLLMFLNSPLKQGALQTVNELMQQHRAYVLYSNSSSTSDSDNSNSQDGKND